MDAAPANNHALEPCSIAEKPALPGVLAEARWPRPALPSLPERSLAVGFSAGVHAAAIATLLFFAPLERAAEGPAHAEIPVELLILPSGEAPAAAPARELDLPAPPEVGAPEIPAEPAAAVEPDLPPLPEIEPSRIVAEPALPEPAVPEPRLPEPPAEAPPSSAPAAVARPFPELPLPDAAEAVLPPAPARPPMSPEPPRPTPTRAPVKRAEAPAAPPKPTARELERRKAAHEARRRRKEVEEALAATVAARRAAEREARRGAAQAFVARGATARPGRAGSASAASASAGSAAASAYRGQVIAHLTRFKRYPESARSRGAEGTPTVAFSLDGGGRVTGAGLSRSSGERDIDAEAVAMVRRAAPFPAPPPGAPRSFSASIGFRMQ
ncbi:MAG: TonB family protein [Microvirga sp.]|jgi:TonB family protein|nr:TonB family protein [Microvirga sp.]